jgi:hypothetical protein
MAGETKRAPNATARVMKTIGYLTDPATLPGKAFTFWERNMTRAMERLAQNDTYLGFAGGMMARGFRAQAQWIDLTEEMLRAMRIPTASDMFEVRDRLRQVSDQTEALGAELEVAIEALERIEKKLALALVNGAPAHGAPQPTE